MDSSSATQALQTIGIHAFGVAMPQLAQDWAVGTANYTPDDVNLALTSGVNCAAPCTAALLVVQASKGQPMPVTLINADGKVQTSDGVLLTVFEAAWLRLARLYAKELETANNNRPEQSNGLPFRQVPRYFFYPGQTNTTLQGIAEAQADLGFAGELRIYDYDGLPIDPLAVMSAFNALMTKFQMLQTGTPVASPALGSNLTSLVTQSDIRVRIVNPDGTPYTGTLLTGLTAVTGAANSAISTITQGTPVAIQAVSANFTQASHDRVLIGPATSGRLSSSFTPPTLPNGVTLQRDFYTLRLVQLTPYLLGASPAADPATQAQQLDQPDVRINESLSLLTNGNDVLGAIGQALVSPATPTLAVAQALDGKFTLPTAAGSSAQWPAFPLPNNTTTDPNAVLSVTLPSSLTVTAAFFNTGASDVTKCDVVLTIVGFPSALANAWVRVYTRRFGADATQARGDGQGRPIPAGGTLSIYLTDPLGLNTPGLSLPGNISIPSSATLNFDMVVVLQNGSARIYGGLSANIGPGPTTAPSFSPGTNATTAATFQGVCSAGILGLGTAVGSGTSPPSTLAAWAEALTGETTPRDASRFPTMARRELLAAGLSGSKWSAVIGGGRIAKETVCALPRLGEPGGYGGRETIVTGVSTQGGRLAYDIARHALRRGQNIASRVVALANSTNWSVPTELTAVPVGQQSSGNSGTFAGALLQNVAPYCETPEMHDPLANKPAGIDDAIDWVINNASTYLPSTLSNQQDIINALNNLKSNPPSGGPALTATGVLIAEELLRELSSSAFGRRDSQWSLVGGIGAARNFIYIETPGFCSTADTSQNPLKAWAADLIKALNTRLMNCPGLRLMICVPKSPDFATGYEGMATYEVQDRYNIIVGNPSAGVPPLLPPAQTVAFHPTGFPGRSSRIESTVVIVDDCWALVGGSTFRSRGLTFDGSSDLVFTDAQVANGISPSIRDFRRALLAARLGLPTDAEHPSYVQLYDGQRSFQLIRQTLQVGGLGKIDRLWNGQTPHVTPATALPIAQANPDGRDFDSNTAALVAVIAASTSGW